MEAIAQCHDGLDGLFCRCQVGAFPCLIQVPKRNKQWVALEAGILAETIAPAFCQTLGSPNVVGVLGQPIS
jgi:hypothetical protein